MIRPPRSTGRRRLTRLVLAKATDYRDGDVVPPHRHAHAQLVHAVTGVMRVTAADGTWVVPPGRALWMPARTVHRIAMAGDVAMRTLYIDRGALPEAPRRCVIVEVSPLLRELVLAAIALAPEEADGARARAIWRLVRAELGRGTVVPLRLPLPRDRRLRRLCEALLAAPARDTGLEQWAAEVGASARTLTRLFRRETGMSFGAWRQQARLADGLARLAQGEAVARVAAALGYRSASAFTQMFRRALGRTPSAYLG
jgi:AraC-like DNA-binding protein/mannose-6-phosphate isomerase-like protein (cupin superfamily)